MGFTFKRLSIPEVILVEPKLYSDSRGFFYESFKESDFFSNEITKFVQDNVSHSINGVIRGLHYQINPKPQAKLVSVFNGKIFDVAVDIRKKSPTYGRWVAEILSDENHRSLYVPEGFAHGFCVMSKEADVFYKVSNEHSPENERGIIWNDPTLNIPWSVKKPIISDKDSKLPLLEETENNFIY
ncbi:dTDP-4-dehydrorhamnose 3,5-epimerase [Nitrosopumilus zosterae]|uniref:dTDP-4-dehydrorhamnose 3,5-epimerase n=1 Tax=Nitrosopumilus zosterae TaxID=718286 RepID=A0A2S2KU37_9ARCH|nr:dTDP-4-dehydrorhamnose 3,5-epimerase [Nitrosopumilus zosterae]BDQ31814.1 dTDP-4-dehydrorhamnose 3,5-epimerase [Nitrosopumilus zosterae]GBH35164.1 dTDP-4-dehydrorhamnose 3,5-epimerase [Nitrosopumilus zosterae]